MEKKEKKETIEQPKFKITDLVGENFEAYKQKEMEFAGVQMVDYIKVNATAVIKKYFDDNLNAQQKLNGISLVKEKILAKTRIEPSTAFRLNEQIWGASATPDTSFYYLVADLCEL